MTDSNSLARDVAFLRSAVERSDRTPGGIYFVWAVVLVLGGIVSQWSPEWSARYWMLAAPVGVAASIVIGWRSGRRAGARGTVAGVRSTFHWAGVTLITFAVMAVALGHDVRPEALGTLAFLVVSLGYYLKAVHTDRSAYAAAAISLGAAGALLLLPGSWFWIGLVCGAGLAGIGLLEIRRGPTDA